MSTTIRVPLYTRASDRDISCPAQWHINAQGIEEHSASWFALGHACHLVAQHAIEEDLTLRRTQNRATKYVREAIEAEEARKPMLWSPNRPKDEILETGRRLVTNWWNDWMVFESETSGPIIMPRLSWPPMLEMFVKLSEADMPEGMAGFKSQLDALFTCRVCKGHVIVDWKSGRTLRHDPLQLQTYRWGLERELGLRFCRCKEGWGFFYNMEDSSLQQVTEYDESDVLWMIADSQSVKRETPIKAVPSWKCNWCVAKSVCPVWQTDDYDREAAQVLLELNRSRYEWITDPAIMEEPSPDNLGDTNGNN